ncbi:unnamed protein product [Alopecurus aequalis]
MATLLSAFIGPCIKNIQDFATEEAVLILGVKEELTNLQQRMRQIQCFISDAEQRSIQESAVSNWLGELRDAMYDADNIIDLARFKGNKLLADHPSSPSRQSNLCLGCSPLSCIANVQTPDDIAVQIRSLNNRIERIYMDAILLTLDNTGPTRKSSVPDWLNLADDIEESLYISYDELPHHLKQCLLYCATYPEDYSMYHRNLTRLWVAEGFVEEQPGQLLEETAEEYYYELIHRNLLQPDSSYITIEFCKMHDLLMQMAYCLSKEECFIGDPESFEGNNMSRLRRISVVTKKDIAVFPTMEQEHFKVRTFRSFSQGIDTSILKKFLYLRVLDLRKSSIQTVPGYIANLIHLRLLDLEGTEISCLPEFISSLINLQMLSLQECKALHSLPSALTQLFNLRRLGLLGTPINQVPKGIGRLEFLNDLDGFPVGGGGDNSKIQDGWRLEELEHLSQLRRLIMIKLESASPCNTNSLLTYKKHLKILSLICTKRTDEPYSEEDVSIIERILEQLIPPHKLEDLKLDGFFGRRFPSWLGTTHLSSIKHLSLVECNFCVHLPSIGQLPNLRYLGIEGATALTKIGPEFVGCRPKSTDVVVAFPKLEQLFITNMPNWEEWSFAEEEDAAAAAATDERDDGSSVKQKEEAPSPKMQLLPCLKTLRIDGCPKLRALPRELGQEATSLEELVIQNTRCLNVVEDLPFLSEGLVLQGCIGLERVSNIPQVRELRINYCPGMTCVEGLGSLQQLWLFENMEELSSLWIPGLQQEHQKLYGEDMDVYAWNLECTRNNEAWLL